MEPKVTILSPCYNVEAYISHFLESIIMQNYHPIELILVNDGSTDNTEDIIFSYKERLEKEGIELKYFSKENGGQASAIALGIKHVTGEYLIWPDSDDFLLPNSIKKRVEYLKENPNCAIVRSNGYIYSEKDLKNPLRKASKYNKIAYLKDFLCFSVPWMPLAYMIRMSCFDEMNPQRKIYISSAGQNIQMILPVVYKYPCEYMEDALYGYVVHENSHSHKRQMYVKQAERLDALQLCVEETLKVISSDIKEFVEINKNFILFCHCRTAWLHGETKEFEKYERILEQKGKTDFAIKVMKTMKPSRFSNLLIRIFNRMRNRKNAK